MPTRKNRTPLPGALKDILQTAPKADPKKKSKPKEIPAVYTRRG